MSIAAISIGEHAVAAQATPGTARISPGRRQTTAKADQVARPEPR